MTAREQELQRQLDHALDRIARLESRQAVVVRAPEPTPYEKFIATGKTHRDWLRYRRQVAGMQNHY